MHRTWLLLLGLGRCSAHWCGFEERLRKQFPADKILCLDLPGLGRLFRDRSPGSIPQAVEAYRRQFFKTRDEEPFGGLYIIGLSMGGMVALDWLERYPREIARVFIVNSSVGSISPWYHRVRPAALLRLAVAFCSPLSERENMIFSMTSNRADRRTEVLSGWLKIARGYPCRPGNLIRQINAARRFRLSSPTCPERITLLASTNDKLVNVECSISMGHNWKQPVHLHNSGGHDLPLDAPDWILQKISGVPGSSRTTTY